MAVALATWPCLAWDVRTNNKKDSITYVGSSAREGALQTLENTLYPVKTVVPRLITVVILTVSQPTLASKDNSPVDRIRQNVESSHGGC